MFRFLLFVLLLVLAWSYWPVTGGDFVIDDYVFIAQSRMVNAPWEALWTNHFYEPTYFRPLGIWSWWIATALFDLNYRAHSAVNLVLHGANALLLAHLVRTLTSRTAPALASAALFAFLPYSFAATLWPSNRFDLLATFFLLATALSCVYFLRHGRPLTWLATGAAALAACLCKELAFPVATALAFACLLAASMAPIQRRAVLFCWLGVAIGGAFFWRHFVLPMPYVAAGGDLLQSLFNGATAWANSSADTYDFATDFSQIARAAIWLSIGLSAFALFTALVWPIRFEKRISLGLLAGGVMIGAASAVAQWPMAAGFSQMLDGGSLGTVTYARFYYAPAAAVAIALGLVISRSRLFRSISAVIVLCAVVMGLEQQSLASTFARWTAEEIRPMSVAATLVAERSAHNTNRPCVLVFLGTQSKHPWFRMFSDVTVKALTTQPQSVWRCHVLTESTPWIFIGSEQLPLSEIVLPIIAIDAVGSAKPDYGWGGVRFRYRLAPTDITTLPNARFFDWINGEFVDVTDTVRSGRRKVRTHGWGF